MRIKNFVLVIDMLEQFEFISRMRGYVAEKELLILFGNWIDNALTLDTFLPNGELARLHVHHIPQNDEVIQRLKEDFDSHQARKILELIHWGNQFGVPEKVQISLVSYGDVHISVDFY